MKKFYIFRKNICLFIKGYKSRIQTLRFNYNKKQKEILPKHSFRISVSLSNIYHRELILHVHG